MSDHNNIQARSLENCYGQAFAALSPDQQARTINRACERAEARKLNPMARFLPTGSDNV